MWHQNVRRVSQTPSFVCSALLTRIWRVQTIQHLSACGKAVATAFGFKKGSNASSYSQLYTAFFLSGVFHCFGDLAVGAPFGSSMPFFVANAAAITLEDAVIAVGRRLRVGVSPGLLESSANTQENEKGKGKGKEGPPPRWVRMLGYAWVFAWFSYALRLFVWWAVPYGMGKTRSNVVPVEILQRFAPEALCVLAFCLFGSAGWVWLIECDFRLSLMKASL